MTTLQNKCVLEGMVKTSDEIANVDKGFLFTLSMNTGTMQYGPELYKDKYTYIKVKQCGTKRFDRTKYPDGIYVKVVGKLDSDVYSTSTGKKVFNKVLLAESITEIDPPKPTE